MIILDGNFLFDLEVGKYKNFINWDDLVEFTLIEEAGCVLPTFDLKFRFSIPELRNYLIENNPLVVILGTDLDNYKTIPLRIFKKNINKYGQGKWFIELSGYLDVLNFIKGTRVTSFKGKGIDAIKSIASRYFTIDTDVSDNSNQTWLCCKKREIDFVSDIWYHLDLSESFPLMAITKDSKMLIKDFTKLSSQKPKWRFSRKPPTNSNEILINGQPDVSNDVSLVNILTQNKNNLIYDMDKGIKTNYLLSRIPKLSNNNTPEESPIDKKESLPYLTNSNVHSNYWQSYVNNTGLLTFVSGVRTVVSHIGRYIDNINVLDIAELLDEQTNSQNETEGLYSGKYIVSKVVRTIDESKNFETHIVLARESFNDIRDYSKEQNQGVFEVEENQSYSRAVSRLNNVITLLKLLLDLRGFKLNYPNMRILAEMLINLFKGLIGIDLNSIWLKLEFILKSTLGNLIYNILKNLFLYLVNKGEAFILDRNSNIMNSINSGSFSKYIDSNGIFNIPNVGSISIDPTDFTSGMFAWYVDGTLTGTPITDIINDNNVSNSDNEIPPDYLSETNVDTGDTDLNNLLMEVISYIKNDSTIKQQDSKIFRRFWGLYDNKVINEDELKLLYTDLSNRRFLDKSITGKGYLYIAYPTYMEQGVIKLNSKIYDRFELVTKKIYINGSYLDYYIYRSLDRFSSKIDLEII